MARNNKKGEPRVEDRLEKVSVGLEEAALELQKLVDSMREAIITEPETPDDQETPNE